MRSGVFKVCLALTGIFVAGGVAGGFASVAWTKQNQERLSAKEYAERQLRRRITDLDLTPEQVEQIRPIMLEFEEQLRGCRRKAMAEVTDVMRAMNARLEQKLTPAQIEKFREIITKERERWEKELQRRSPRPPSDQRREGDRPAPVSPRDTSNPPASVQGPETIVSPPAPTPTPPASSP